MQETESFVQIPICWPGWRISTRGHVMSPRGTVLTPQPITSRYSDTKYVGVKVMLGNGLKVSKSVHGLVLLTFCHPGMPPPGYECSHKNGNKQDNRWPENIGWIRHPDNVREAWRSPTHRGHSSRLLTDDQVRAIRLMRDCGVLGRVIAAQYGISIPHAIKIGRRVALARVPEFDDFSDSHWSGEIEYGKDGGREESVSQSLGGSQQRASGRI